MYILSTYLSGKSDNSLPDNNGSVCQTMTLIDSLGLHWKPEGSKGREKKRENVEGRKKKVGKERVKGERRKEIDKEKKIEKKQGKEGNK